ncbi:hypothetical protein HPP92_026552 [Vanilla planifolia]|uniref:WPP domain-associated protein n=1 Tax=Vanilla planifolia TaxID=51239 RepID=A0A835U7F2_VANPL|nr:hypothetical protein HPP92_026552 [Vanilla planifolia]
MENLRKDFLNVDAKDLYVSGSSVNANAINHAKCLDRLRIAVEEQVQKLKKQIGSGKREDLRREDALDGEKLRIKFQVMDECVHSLESLLEEMHTWIAAVISPAKKDIQLDTSSAILQTLITCLHQEYKSLLKDLKHKWQRSFDELHVLWQSLDDISKSLISLEPGFVFPHGNLEVLEERNALKRKDQPHRKQIGNCAAFLDECTQCLMEKTEGHEKHSTGDSPQLLCQTKEELIGYFKTEIAKMKRQHDIALQEKTEELFCLKREFLKEKGSNHLNFKKDKEFELMKKRIVEIVAKMDDILCERKNISILFDGGLRSLKEKGNALVLENQWIAPLLVAKNEENIPIFSKALETTGKISDFCIGADLIDQMEKLQIDMEALKFEANVKDVINGCTLKELPGELGFITGGMHMETKFEQYIYSFIIKEFIEDIIYRFNNIVVGCHKEKDSVLQNILEKEKALSSEVEENKRLKQQLESSSTLLKTMEKRTADLEAALVQQSQQCSLLREHAIKQELAIVEAKVEYELAKFRLEESVHCIHQYGEEVNKLNERLKTASIALQDAEKQKNILQFKLLVNQEELSSAVVKVKEQAKHIESMVTSIFDLSNSFDGWGNKITVAVEHNESRLKVLSYQNDELLKQAGMLRKKIMCYKQVFEMRCDDLRKAENEVDLLGDEVDYLLSLLSKIYIALEHYSSVLNYYPGVMEIVKLIRREVGIDESKPLR